LRRFRLLFSGKERFGWAPERPPSEPDLLGYLKGSSWAEIICK
jgi:hypothetical protein